MQNSLLKRSYCRLTPRILSEKLTHLDNRNTTGTVRVPFSKPADRAAHRKLSRGLYKASMMKELAKQGKLL